jgi:site-specific DNA recombinase
MRAVVYARLSEDHERAESVPTQIANGTKYADRMGWEVVRVLKDRRLSGYTGGVRPDFEEMIKFLGGGQADVLITRHHDRLTRNPEDFARLMQVCGKAKIKISLHTGGELDLSTASGGSTASWIPVDLGTSLRSEASASRMRSSATPVRASGPVEGRGRSATRSSMPTSAKGPSVRVASFARSWNRLRPTLSARLSAEF